MTQKPKLEIASEFDSRGQSCSNTDPDSIAASATVEKLDEEEQEFRALRCDLARR